MLADGTFRRRFRLDHEELCALVELVRHGQPSVALRCATSTAAVACSAHPDGCLADRRNGWLHQGSSFTTLSFSRAYLVPRLCCYFLCYGSTQGNFVWVSIARNKWLHQGPSLTTFSFSRAYPVPRPCCYFLCYGSAQGHFVWVSIARNKPSRLIFCYRIFSLKFIVHVDQS